MLLALWPLLRREEEATAPVWPPVYDQVRRPFPVVRRRGWTRLTVTVAWSAELVVSGSGVTVLQAVVIPLRAVRTHGVSGFTVTGFPSSPRLTAVRTQGRILRVASAVECSGTATSGGSVFMIERTSRPIVRECEDDLWVLLGDPCPFG